jgi:hypothetical protein
MVGVEELAELAAMADQVYEREIIEHAARVAASNQVLNLRPGTARGPRDLFGLQQYVLKVENLLTHAPSPPADATGITAY